MTDILIVEDDKELASLLTDFLRAKRSRLTTSHSIYPHLTAVVTDADLYRSAAHYLIIEADGTLYRVEYTIGSGRQILHEL